jgi:hypothetical protein
MRFRNNFLLLIFFNLIFSLEIKVKDTPNDAGNSLTILIVEPQPEVDFYQVFRKDEGDFVLIGKLAKDERVFLDDKVKRNKCYYYQVVGIKDTFHFYSNIASAIPRAQIFNTARINVLIGIIIFSFLILYFIRKARRGEKLFIRRISGLDAVEEAVGRATEMGKPILFVPGIGSVADIATIAALNILGEVAKKTAQYDTTLLVPNRDVLVYTVAYEIVKEAYSNVGRPDAFKEGNIFYITDSQFAFTAAVDGIMVREKPATNFFLGTFYAESLILAETGAATGAIQIAGTDMVPQLPFFIVACDYTLIGEELYAASAYLSREPLLLGSLKGQDYGKLLILFVLLVGSFLLLLSYFPSLSFFSKIIEFFNVY